MPVGNGSRSGSFVGRYIIAIHFLTDSVDLNPIVGVSPRVERADQFAVMFNVDKPSLASLDLREKPLCSALSHRLSLISF